MTEKAPLPPGATRIKGTDGSMTFDGQCVAISHKWYAKAGGGQSRYPLASVSGVDVKNGVILAAVTLVVPGGVLRKGKGDPLTVKGFEKREAAQFRDLVVTARAALDAPPAVPVTTAPEPAPAAAVPGLVEQIQQLAALHSQGALSDEEFSAAKMKLLNIGVPQDAPPRHW